MTYNDTFDMMVAILCLTMGGVIYTIKGPRWLVFLALFSGIVLIFAIIKTLGQV
jgi:hypothetical protein